MSKPHRSAAQRGFTMIELTVVIGLVAVLMIIGIPFVRNFMIDGKVPKVADDITKVATKLRTNFSGQGATPYTSISTASFANTAKGMASVLIINGSGATATVTHDIGATGSTVTAASATITTAGDSFAVTVNDAAEAACPSLAAGISKAAERITINGTTVKAVGGNYNGATASTACTAGDTNDFVFTFR